MKCTDTWDIFAVLFSWYLPNDWWCIMLYNYAWVKVKAAQSRATLQRRGLYSPWNSPGQNTAEGILSLLQGIFPTQGSNPGLPHCRRILYQRSHRGAQEYWVGSLSLLQGIFPTQELSWGLLHCRRILYHWAMRWVKCPFKLQERPSGHRCGRLRKAYWCGFRVHNSSAPLGNHRLRSFGVTSEENIHTHLKIFYNTHLIIYICVRLDFPHILISSRNTLSQWSEGRRYENVAGFYNLTSEMCTSLARKQLLSFYKHMVFMLTCNGFTIIINLLL